MVSVLYFCNLDVDTLRAMAFCCLRSFTALSDDGNPNVKVEYDLLKLDFAHMNAVCERAGMFEQLIEARTNAVIAYFGLPTEGAVQQQTHE